MLYQKQGEILSVPSLNAEEILDAGIIKSASRPANLRPNAEETLDAGIIKAASRPANLRQEAQSARIEATFCKPILMKFQVRGLRRRIHQNRQLMAQNARIKSAFCKPRLVEFQSTWTQTPDSSNRRLMIQNTKIKSAFCKLRPETFTIRNILSEGLEVRPGYHPKDCVWESNTFLMC